MTALHRMKAYFGMVPADELDAYDGYGAYDEDRRRESERRGRYDDRYDDRYEIDRWDAERRHESRYAHAGASGHADEEDRRRDRLARYDDDRARAPRPRDPEYDEVESAAPARAGQRGRSWAQNTGPNHTSVRGLGASGPSRAPLSAVGAAAGPPVAAAATAGSSSLAGSSSSTGGSGSGGSGSAASDEAPITRGSLAEKAAKRPEPEAPAATAEPAPAAPAEIITLRPTSYNEARVIGENYRDGIPVIMNLTELDDGAAKRLVDFAAGLAFALRGSIEKVTNRVFLLSPPNVEVSAADRNRFAQGS